MLRASWVAVGAAVFVAVSMVGASLNVSHASSTPPPKAYLRAHVSHRAGFNGTYFWTDLTGRLSTAPYIRTFPQIAYSPPLGKVILFGGYNGTVAADRDTWQFSGGGWYENSAISAPTQRWGGGMVYDAADGYLLMFGGRNDNSFMNDTWSYTSTGWHQILTSRAPSVRAFEGLAYDAADRVVVLFGGGVGNLPAGTYTPWVLYNDTWTYRAGVWTNISSTAGPAPSPRQPGGMVYDAADGYVLLQGGTDPNNCPGVTNDSWEFVNGRWTLLHPAKTVPLLGENSVTFGSTSNATLLYQGGYVQPGCGGSNWGSEVWSYSAGTWALALGNGTGTPPGRTSGAWVDDPHDGVELLFGGNGAAGFIGDTWVLTPDFPLSIGRQIAANRTSADVGQSVSFTDQALYGGAPPYAYAWNGLPSGCQTSLGAATCTFGAAADLNVSLTVTDSQGAQSTSASLHFSVYLDPSLPSAPASVPDPAVVGEPVSFAVVPTGGSGGFQFRWLGLPPGCTSEDLSALVCTPSTSGTYLVSVLMNDSNGKAATSPTLSLVVNAAVGPAPCGSCSLLGVVLSPYFLAGLTAVVAVAIGITLVLRRRKQTQPPPPPAN